LKVSKALMIFSKPRRSIRKTVPLENLMNSISRLAFENLRISEQRSAFGNQTVGLGFRAVSDMIYAIS
jgi:hypothetical protein